MATIITGYVPDVGITPIDVVVSVSSLYGEDSLSNKFRIRGTGQLVEGPSFLYGDVHIFEGGDLNVEGHVTAGTGHISTQQGDFSTESGTYLESGIPIASKIDHLKQSILKTGLVLDLDATNLNSYPRSGTFWHDLTHKGHKGSISGANGESVFYSNEFRFDASADKFINVDNSEGLNPQKFGLGTYFRPDYNGSGSADVIAGKSYNATKLSIGHTYTSTNKVISTIRFTDGTESKVAASNISANEYHNVFTKWDGTNHIVYTGGKFVSGRSDFAGKTISYSEQPLSIAARYYNQTSKNFFKGGVESVALYNGEVPEVEIFKNDFVLKQLNLHKDVNITGSLKINGTDIQSIVDSYARAVISGDSASITGNTFEVVNVYGTGVNISGSVGAVNNINNVSSPGSLIVNGGTSTINYSNTSGAITLHNNGVGSTTLFNTYHGGKVDAVISGYLFVIEKTENLTIYNQNRAIIDRNSGEINIQNLGGSVVVSGTNDITVNSGTLFITGEVASGDITIAGGTNTLTFTQSKNVNLNQGTNTISNANLVFFTGDSTTITSSTVHTTGDNYDIDNSTVIVSGIDASTFNITSGSSTVNVVAGNTLAFQQGNTISIVNSGTLNAISGTLSIPDANNTSFTISNSDSVAITRPVSGSFSFGTGTHLNVSGGTNSFDLRAMGGGSTSNDTLIHGGVNSLTNVTSPGITGTGIYIYGDIGGNSTVSATNLTIVSGGSVSNVGVGNSAQIHMEGGPHTIVPGTNATINITGSNNSVASSSDSSTFNLFGSDVKITGNVIDLVGLETISGDIFVNTHSGFFTIPLATSASQLITISGGTNTITVPITTDSYAEGGTSNTTVYNAEVVNLSLSTGVKIYQTGLTANISSSDVDVSVGTGGNAHVYQSGEDINVYNSNNGYVTIQDKRNQQVVTHVTNQSGGLVSITGGRIYQTDGTLTAHGVGNLNYHGNSGSVTATNFNLQSGNVKLEVPRNAAITVGGNGFTHIYNSGVINATGIDLISGGMIEIDRSSIHTLTGMYVSAYNTAVTNAYWTVYSTGAYNFMTGVEINLLNYGSGTTYIDILNKTGGVWTGNVNIYSGITNISGIDTVNIYSGSSHIYNTNSGLEPHAIHIQSGCEITIDNTHATNLYAPVTGTNVTISNSTNWVSGENVTISGGTNYLSNIFSGALTIIGTGNKYNFSGGTISITGGPNYISGTNINLSASEVSVSGAHTVNITGNGSVTFTSGSLIAVATGVSGSHVGGIVGVDINIDSTSAVNVYGGTSTTSGENINLHGGVATITGSMSGVNVYAGATANISSVSSSVIGSGNVINVINARSNEINSETTNIVGGINTFTGAPSTISGGLNTINATSITGADLSYSTNVVTVAAGGVGNLTITTGYTDIFASGTNNIYNSTIDILGGTNVITGTDFIFRSGSSANFTNSGEVTITSPSVVYITNEIKPEVHGSGVITGNDYSNLQNIYITGAQSVHTSGGTVSLTGDNMYVSANVISGVTAQTFYATGFDSGSHSNIYVTLSSGTIDVSHVADPKIYNSDVVVSGHNITISGSVVNNATGTNYTLINSTNYLVLNQGADVDVTGDTTAYNSGILNSYGALTAYYGYINNSGNITSSQAGVVNVYSGNYYSSGLAPQTVNIYTGVQYITGQDVNVSLTNTNSTFLNQSNPSNLEVVASNSTIYIPTGHTGVSIHHGSGNLIYVQSGHNLINSPSTVHHGVNTINSTGVTVQAGRNFINTTNGNLVEIYYGNTVVRDNSGHIEIKITGGNNYIHTGVVYITGGDNTNINIYDSTNSVHVTGENPSVGIQDSHNFFTSNWTGLVQISGTSVNTILNTGLVLIDTGANNYIYGGNNNLTGIQIYITGGVNTYNNQLGGLTQITGGINTIDNSASGTAGSPIYITGGVNTVNTGTVGITGGTTSVDNSFVRISGSDVAISSSTNDVYENDRVNINGVTNVFTSGNDARTLLHLVSGTAINSVAEIYNYGTGFQVISGVSYISGENLSIHDSDVNITGGIIQAYNSDFDIEVLTNGTFNTSTGTIALISGTNTINNSTVEITTSAANTINSGTVTITSGTNTVTCGTIASINGGVSTISIGDSGSITQSGGTATYNITGTETVTIDSTSSNIFITGGTVDVAGSVSSMSVTGISSGTFTNVQNAHIHQGTSSQITTVHTGYFNQGTTTISALTSGTILGGVNTIHDSTNTITATGGGFFTFSGGTNTITGTNATFNFSGVNYNNINAPNSSLNLNNSVNTITGGNQYITSGINSIYSGISHITGNSFTIEGGTTNIVTGTVQQITSSTVNFTGTASISGGTVNITEYQNGTVNNPTSVTLNNTSGGSATIRNYGSSPFSFTVEEGTNTISIESGASVTGLNVSGNITATSSTVNVTTSSSTELTFNANNTVAINNGTNTINSVSGITVTNGSNVINSSTVYATGETFSVSGGTVHISGGTSTVSNSTAFISGSTITADNSTNTLNLSAPNSTFSITSGTNSVTGNITTLTVTGGTNTINDGTTVTLNTADTINNPQNITLNGDQDLVKLISGSLFYTGTAPIVITGGTNTLTNTGAGSVTISGGINTIHSNVSNFQGDLENLTITNNTGSITGNSVVVNGGTNTLNAARINVSGTVEGGSNYSITGDNISVVGGTNTFSSSTTITLSGGIISGGVNTVTSTTANITGGVNNVTGTTINITSGTVTAGSLNVSSITSSNFTSGNNSFTGTFNDPVYVTQGTNSFSSTIPLVQITGGTANFTGATVTISGGTNNIPNSTISNINGSAIVSNSTTTINGGITNAYITGGTNRFTGTTISITGGDNSIFTSSISGIFNSVVSFNTSTTTFNLSGKNNTYQISGSGNTITISGANKVEITGGTSTMHNPQSVSLLDSVGHFSGIDAVGVTGGTSHFHITDASSAVTVNNSFSQTIESGLSNTVVNNNFHYPTIVSGGTVYITGDAGTLANQILISQSTGTNITFNNPVQSGGASLVSITGGVNTLNYASGAQIYSGVSVTLNSSSADFSTATLISPSISNSTNYITGGVFNITGGTNTVLSTGQTFNITNAQSMTVSGTSTITGGTITINDGTNTINQHTQDITVNYNPNVASGVSFNINSGETVNIYQFRNIETIDSEGSNISASAQQVNITGGVSTLNIASGGVAYITGASVTLTGDVVGSITDVDVVNYHLHNNVTLTDTTGNLIGSVNQMTFSGEALNVSGSITITNGSDIDIARTDNLNNVDSNVSLISSAVAGNVNNFGGLTQFYNSTVDYYSVTGSFSSNTLVTHTAANSFTTGDIVRFDNSSNKYVKAIANNEENSRVAGVISRVTGTTFDITTHGEFLLGGYSAGKQLYLSPTSSGLLTTVKPTIAGHVVQPIAKTANSKLIVNVENPELLRNFTGANIVLGADPSASATSSTSTHFTQFASSETVIASREIDMTQTGTHTIHLPSNKRVFIDEMGIVFTDINTITMGPKFKIGSSGSLEGLFDDYAVKGVLQNYSRERIIVPDDTAGQTNIIATITSGATANTCEGKFYYKGFVMETE